MAQEWDIKPRDEACYGCRIPFADKQAYVSSLQFEDEGYVRADFCEACWESHKERAAPYSSWQGMFRMPPPPEEEPLKKETAESLLRKLMEDDDPANTNVIYILAVMLERKRMLIEKDIRKKDTGETIRVYEHRRTGEVFLVPDPHLKIDELETVQQEVLGLLGGGPTRPRDAEEEEPDKGSGEDDPKEEKTS